MNDWPFHNKLRDGYEAFRAGMHIPTALFGAILDDRVPKHIREYCDSHMEVCRECRESFDCFKEILATGKVSGVEDIATPYEIRRSQSNVLNALKRRIREETKTEPAEPQFAGPDDAEFTLAYGVEQYGAKGDRAYTGDDIDGKGNAKTCPSDASDEKPTGKDPSSKETDDNEDGDH